MKKRIKILKPVQSYVIGNIYRVSPHFAGKLIGRKQAEPVPDVKEEKTVIKTKEEKFIPETKEILSISKLRPAISTMSMEELKSIAEKDERVSARDLANKEISKRT